MGLVVVCLFLSHTLFNLFYTGRSFQDYTSIDELSPAVGGPLRVPLPERYEVNSSKSNMADTDKGQCGIVCGCTKVIQQLKAANIKAEEDKRDLEREITVLQESLSIRDVHSPPKPDRSAEELEYVNALLCLGQMSSEIQTFMYRYVHPSLFREKESYLFDSIKRDIKKIDDPILEKEAKGRWAGLKETINWNDRIHTSKVISIYTTRNKKFHPVVSEEKLRESLAVWRRLGELNGPRDEETIEELIERWKTMRNWQF